MGVVVRLVRGADGVSASITMAGPDRDHDFVPRPHQIEAKEAILAARQEGRPGFLLGDLTGLGSQVAGSLAGVVSQRLIVKREGKGRVVAAEVMTGSSPTVRKQIEEGNAAELYTAIRDGHHFGMNTMNQSLERLYQAKLVSYEDCMANAGNLTELRHMLRRS